MGQERRSESLTRRRARVGRPASLDGRLGRRVGPAWLTVSQLCRRWQLGRKTVYKFIDAEILPAWRVSSRLYRIAVEDVLRFEARNKMSPK